MTTPAPDPAATGDVPAQPAPASDAAIQDSQQSAQILTAEQDTAIRSLVAEMTSSFQPSLGFDPATIRKATVTARDDAANPPSITVQYSADPAGTPSDPIANVRYIDSYTPVVGDTTLLIKQGTDILALGQINDASQGGSAQGWQVTGGVSYRKVVQSGDFSVQFKGSWATGGSATLFTLPAGYCPSVARNLIVATDSSANLAQINVATTGVVTLVGATAFPTTDSTTPAATGASGGDVTGATNPGDAAASGGDVTGSTTPASGTTGADGDDVTGSTTPAATGADGDDVTGSTTPAATGSSGTGATSAGGNGANATGLNTGSTTPTSGTTSSGGNGANATGLSTGSASITTSSTTLSGYTGPNSANSPSGSGGLAAHGHNLVDISAHNHTGGSHVHDMASHGHSIDAHSHTYAGVAHTHTLGSHGHSIDDHSHTGPAHTHTSAAHTHTQPTHTHTSAAHTHTQPTHTHTYAGVAHTHTQPTHTHTMSATHTHTQPTHTHTSAAHTHTVTVAIPATVYFDNVELFL